MSERTFVQMNHHHLIVRDNAFVDFCAFSRTWFLFIICSVAMLCSVHMCLFLYFWTLVYMQKKSATLLVQNTISASLSLIYHWNWFVQIWFHPCCYWYINVYIHNEITFDFIEICIEWIYENISILVLPTNAILSAWSISSFFVFSLVRLLKCKPIPQQKHNHSSFFSFLPLFP